MRCLAFAALVTGVLGLETSAQQASYTYIDQTLPYTNPGWLTARNTPRIGQVFTLEVPTSTGYWENFYLITGTTRILFDLGSVQLPYWGTPSGYWFTNVVVVLPTPTGGLGQPGTINISIPNTATLQGAQFYQQVLGFIDYTAGICSACPPGVAASRGGHGIIGP